MLPKLSTFSEIFQGFEGVHLLINFDPISWGRFLKPFKFTMIFIECRFDDIEL